jgi:hypothetical protein
MPAPIAHNDVSRLPHPLLLIALPHEIYDAFQSLLVQHLFRVREQVQLFDFSQVVLYVSYHVRAPQDEFHAPLYHGDGFQLESLFRLERLSGVMAPPTLLDETSSAATVGLVQQGSQLSPHLLEERSH